MKPTYLVGVGLSSDGYPAYHKLPNGQTRRIHTQIAERALGHKLPVGSGVHHVDGDKLNFSPTNLVIYPNAAYHKLLHIRTRALEATGDPAQRQCGYCHGYSPVAELIASGRLRVRYWHRECHNSYQKRWRSTCAL